MPSRIINGLRPFQWCDPRRTKWCHAVQGSRRSIYMALVCPISPEYYYPLPLHLYHFYSSSLLTQFQLKRISKSLHICSNIWYLCILYSHIYIWYSINIFDTYLRDETRIIQVLTFILIGVSFAPKWIINYNFGPKECGKIIVLFLKK